MAHQKSDGMNYAPLGKPSPVVKPGEFVFAATTLDHGHIYGQCQGLTEAVGDHLFLVDNQGGHHIRCHGEVGFLYFGQLILDCLNRTENAMTQEHAFHAAALSIEAQAVALHIE